jgi:[acyl-carrier-protein] S-malonyltransferase
VKLAVLFPGQGSQAVGMARDFYDAYPVAREAFDAADKALGFSLTSIIFEDPDAELTKTAITQPAILTASVAIWRVLEGFEPNPAFFAGHSLGEYTALVAAGALAFEDAVNLVHLRGTYMQETVPIGEGAMAAVMGIDHSRLEEIVVEVDAAGTDADGNSFLVQIANFNSPEQTVISGTKHGVAAASEKLKAAGAKRVVELNVSAPFHCALMNPAADKLWPHLIATHFRKTEVPVIANKNALPYPDEPETYAAILRDQITSPVRWVGGIRYMLRGGVDRMVEVGPGKVLRMLATKIERSLAAYNVDTVETLKAFLPVLTGEASRQA